MIKNLLAYIDKKLNITYNKVSIGRPKDIPIFSPDCGWNHGETKDKGGGRNEITVNSKEK